MAEPTRQQWQRLYELAIELKEMAPWNWMSEVDLFGLQNPRDGQLGFVSIMGELGEHLALALYRGPKGLAGFWSVAEDMDFELYPDISQVPHLQAAFEDRNILTDQDRKLIKALGLKFRGRQSWPMFRSYRPGYFPWYLEADEVHFLTLAMEQALEIAPRFKADPDYLRPEDPDAYLIRVPHETPGGLVWEDRATSVSFPDEPAISIPMDSRVLQHLAGLAPSGTTLEVDVSLLHIRIGERGERPIAPWLLMVVEAASGMVLGSKLMTVDGGSLEELWGSVPLELAVILARIDLVPRYVQVTSQLVGGLVNTLGEELGFEVQRVRRLPALESARAFTTSRLF
jgi:hypothetical protein